MDSTPAASEISTTTREVPGILRAQIRAMYDQLIAQRGGKKRRGQQMIIGAVATAVAHGKRISEKEGVPQRLLAVQAPTGTGKSIGYALGAIPVAMAMGFKVVIATGTIALQEQLVDEELPRLAGVIKDMQYVLVKGRGRYGCPVRMRDFAEQGNATAAFLLTALEAGEWSGDVDSLAEPLDAAQWAPMTNDRNGCSGRKCSRYNACPFYKAREAGKSANVFVANQDLVLSDLRGGSVVLPKPEETVYVIDEAHELPAKALKMMGEAHALQECEAWADSVDHLMARLRRTRGAKVLGAKAIEVLDSAAHMRGCTNEARMFIETRASTAIRDPQRPLRFAHGKLPTWLQEIAKRSEEAATAAFDAIESLRELMDSDVGDGIPEAERELLLSELGRSLAVVRRVRGVWKMMGTDLMDSAPPAKWVEVVEQHEQRDLRVCASPVGVGEQLHEQLWSRCAAAVHLSATLYTLGGFQPYLKASGLALSGPVSHVQVDSPFDFSAQGRLIVPKTLRSPKDAAGHTEDLCQQLPAWLASRPEGEGALVLFASWSQMSAVAQTMPPEIRRRMLVQGERSKRDIVVAHRAAIEAGRSSIIFGTASFETGIDLPGKLLTLVVVAKLQFPVPSGPVEEARSEWLQGIGKSYFDEVALPEACKRLAQSCGRLIRTEDDHGDIIVADNRLSGTSYGRAMLAALPSFQFAAQL